MSYCGECHRFNDNHDPTCATGADNTRYEIENLKSRVTELEDLVKDLLHRVARLDGRDE